MEKQGFDYAVERGNGKKIVTNQHFQVAIEGALKDFHFAAVSNSIPTEVRCGLRLKTCSTNAYRLRSQITRTP